MRGTEVGEYRPFTPHKVRPCSRMRNRTAVSKKAAGTRAIPTAWQLLGPTCQGERWSDGSRPTYRAMPTGLEPVARGVQALASQAGLGLPYEAADLMSVLRHRLVPPRARSRSTTCSRSASTAPPHAAIICCMNTCSVQVCHEYVFESPSDTDTTHTDDVGWVSASTVCSVWL
jgi:hypothetical protein